MSATTTSLDHLLANAAWARRLATRLTRDPDDADDLVQDALLASVERPSAPSGASRPWLSAIIGNLYRSTLRSKRRRDRREEAAGSHEAEVPAAEETLAALQIHRRLSALVAELAEPYRQTVLLRYFEDRSAAEIAALTAVPAGTVRWRLKMGLDQLRARLDEEPGGRKAWMLVLGRFARGERRRPVLPGRTAIPLRLALTAILTATLIAGGVGLLHRRTEDPGAPAGGSPDVTTAARPGPDRGRPALFAAVAGETLPACNRRLADLRGHERELLMKIAPPDLFEAGAPNPAAQAEMGDAIDRALAPLAGRLAGHAVDCRTYACQLLVLLSDPLQRDLYRLVDRALEPILQERARAQGMSFEIAPDGSKLIGTPALGGERVHVVRHTLLLEDVSGRAVPLATLGPGEPEARRAVHLSTLPETAPTLDRCQAEARDADARIRALEARWSDTKPLSVVFQESALQPELTARVDAELRRALSALGYPWFYVVVCRGSICSVDADDPDDNDKRNRIVGPMDRVIQRDPWFSRRVQGRLQSGAVFFRLENR